MTIRSTLSKNLSTYIKASMGRNKLYVQYQSTPQDRQQARRSHHLGLANTSATMQENYSPILCDRPTRRRCHLSAIDRHTLSLSHSVHTPGVSRSNQTTGPVGLAVLSTSLVALVAGLLMNAGRAELFGAMAA